MNKDIFGLNSFEIKHCVEVSVYIPCLLLHIHYTPKQNSNKQFCRHEQNQNQCEKAKAEQKNVNDNKFIHTHLFITLNEGLILTIIYYSKKGHNDFAENKDQWNSTERKKKNMLYKSIQVIFDRGTQAAQWIKDNDFNKHI